MHGSGRLHRCGNPDYRSHADKMLRLEVDCELVSDCEWRLLGSDRLERSLANVPPAGGQSMTETKG